MLLVKAKKIMGGNFILTDHLGNKKEVTSKQLKRAMLDGKVSVLNYKFNGSNQLVEKEASKAEEALWRIYEQVELFSGNDGYVETEEDDADDHDAWMHYKYYEDKNYFLENVAEIVESYFA